MIGLIGNNDPRARIALPTRERITESECLRRFGPLAEEFFGVKAPEIIRESNSTAVSVESKPKIILDEVAVLTVQALNGVSRKEASRQVQIAQERNPNGDTQSLVLDCLGSK